MPTKRSISGRVRVQRELNAEDNIQLQANIDNLEILDFKKQNYPDLIEKPSRMGGRRNWRRR